MNLFGSVFFLLAVALPAVANAAAASDASDGVATTVLFTLIPLLLAALLTGGIWVRRYAQRRDEQGLEAELLVHKTPMYWALLVAAAGAILTFVLANQTRQDNYAAARLRFMQQVELTEQQIQSEVHDLTLPLMAIRGAFVASEDVTNRDFSQLMQALEIRRVYSGVRGFGFVERVARKDAAAFVAAQRRNGKAEFSINVMDASYGTALGETAGNDDLLVVKFIEPDYLNRFALGFDLGSERLRRDAAETAAKSGEPAMTPKVTLKTDSLHRPGFLMFVPVFAKGSPPDSLDARKRSIRGWAIATVVWSELLAQIPELDRHTTDFQIFDAPDASQQSLIFDSLVPVGETIHSESLTRERGRMFSVLRPVMLADQIFYFKTESTPAFESGVDRSAHLKLAMWGSTLSVLGSIVIWLLLAGRSRAEKIAQGMTADLERLAMVAKRTNNSVVITDLQRRITWVNDGFTRISGYTLDEVVGKVPGSFLQSEQTDPSMRRVIGEELTALRASHHVIRNRHKDGHHYWLEFEILPLYNNKGEPTGYMGVQSDVTTQVEAREALAREKDRAENILSGTNVGTWESNLITGESRWNDRWHSMMGYVREEVVPDADGFWQELLHPDDKVRLNNAMRSCTTGSLESYSSEVRARHKDGHWMWILSRARVMSRTPDGRVEWIGGVHTDISESKQTELDLRDTKAFLDRAGRVAGVGAWQADLVSGVVIWSEQTCAIHGVMPGHSPTMEESMRFYPPQAREKLQAGMERAIADGHSWDLVIEFVNAQGTALWVRSFGEAEYDDRGPVRIVGAIQDVTKDKLAQLEVERSSALLRGAIDAIDEAFVIYDPQDRLLYCNDKYRMLYATSTDLMVEGADFEYIIRTGVQRGQYPEAIGHEEEWIAARLAHHRTGNISAVQRLNDGRWLKVLERKMPDGHTVGFRVDITSLKHATELAESTSAALAVERERLQGILEGTNVGTWEWSVQTGEVVLNERWAAICGYTLEELAPVDINAWIRLSHPQDLEKSNEMLMRHFEGKSEFYECEARMRHKDGRWIWVLDRGKVSRWNEQGKPLVMSGTHMDITVRKEAERSFAELSATLQNVLDAAVNVAIVSSGLERTVEVFNKGAENLLGYAAEEIVGKDFGINFFEPSELAALSESLELVNGREPTVQELFAHIFEIPGPQEWTLVRKDGERFKASLISSPMRDLEGGLTGNLCIVYDISKQKEFESSLREAMHLAEQSSVAKSQFLANMSHEIRTPMNAILGMLQLLNTTALDRRQEDYVDKAKGAAKSLLGLLNDILDFSKVEAGKMQLAPELFDLDTVLEDLSVILSSNLGGKEVDLVYDIDPAIPRQLIGDALRIKQVLINLGGNAVKFTQQGEVVLRMSLLARTPERIRLQIAVVDSGIGIAPENQARIFEAFTQAEANTTRRFGGTGLGLVISTRLIRLMGSELELASVPGKGSTFSFALDLPAATLATETQSSAASPFETYALLVDDNPLACAANANMLRGLGWHVQEANSGQQALDWLQARHQSKERAPDVVFVDSRMADMNGRQMVSAARRMYSESVGPQFVLLTGDNREVLNVRSEENSESPDGVAVKPLTAAMFAHALVLARSAVKNSGTLEAGYTKAAGTPLVGMRVLLVEDNQINQQVAFELLTAQGALVTLAENGLEGLNAIRAGTPVFDAVLMDLQMPVMDGLTATRALREDTRFATLPVIAMTANAMDADRTACLEAGMNDHVGKPFDLKTLVDTLVRHTRWQPRADLLPMPLNEDSSTGMPAQAQAFNSAWPAGLEIDTALSRMGGNRSLLKRAMTAFVADARLVGSRVHALLESNALSDAKRELHAFKGLAATLGAPELAKTAAAAEKAVVEAPKSVSEAMLADLERQLQTLLPRLQEVALALEPVRAGPDKGAAEASDKAGLIADLRALLKLLQDSNMEAMVVHADLRQNVNAAYAPSMESLDGLMAEMELDAAAVECEKLLKQLESK